LEQPRSKDAKEAAKKEEAKPDSMPNSLGLFEILRLFDFAPWLLGCSIRPLPPQSNKLEQPSSEDAKEAAKNEESEPDSMPNSSACCDSSPL
jgi:hypothetical protein